MSDTEAEVHPGAKPPRKTRTRKIKVVQKDRAPAASECRTLTGVAFQQVEKELLARNVISHLRSREFED